MLVEYAPNVSVLPVFVYSGIVPVVNDCQLFCIVLFCVASSSSLLSFRDLLNLFDFPPFLCVSDLPLPFYFSPDSILPLSGSADDTQSITEH